MKRVKLAEYERGLETRQAKAGLSGRDFVRPNSGVARTPEKKALLRALDEAARASGRAPRFKTKG